MATPEAKYWVATAMYLNVLSPRATASPPRLLAIVAASSYCRRGAPLRSVHPTSATR